MVAHASPACSTWRLRRRRRCCWQVTRRAGPQGCHRLPLLRRQRLLLLLHAVAICKAGIKGAATVQQWLLLYCSLLCLLRLRGLCIHGLRLRLLLLLGRLRLLLLCLLLLNLL
jgi:hypothetical protein